MFLALGGAAFGCHMRISGLKCEVRVVLCIQLARGRCYPTGGHSKIEYLPTENFSETGLCFFNPGNLSSSTCNGTALQTVYYHPNLELQFFFGL